MSKKPAETSVIVSSLREIRRKLIERASAASLSPRARRNLKGEIKEIIGELDSTLNDLDPIRQPTAVFDPGNPRVVGRFIALALIAQPRQPLSNIARFYGSGIYAIYYKGSFKHYGPISGTESPIYIGQAAPAINEARTSTEQGIRLCRRLDDHRKNIINSAATLNINDFEFRSLVVQSGWESAAEDYLIQLFHPIWNKETKILFGIGKHGDAAKTRSNKRSPWDTLHSGRKWAKDETLTDAKPITAIATELAVHFRTHPPFESLQSVLESFIDELRQDR